ncbi:MAG: DUF6624 domain-containing protein [Bacteroidota bacterium]
MLFLGFIWAISFEGMAQMPSLSYADSCFRVGAFVESGKTYTRIWETGKTKDPQVAYKAGVSLARTGQAPLAILMLQHAVDMEIDDAYLSGIRFDPAYNAIRHTPEWRSFLKNNLGQYDQAAAHISYPALRAELLQLWQADQYYRALIFGSYNGRPPNEVGRATEAVDRFNTKRLEQIVDQIGWPTHKKVGKDGAHAAWNIVQHAVFNPPFMRRCLDSMKVALAQQQVDGVDFAFLYDRFQVLCNFGLQEYGIVRRVPIRDEHLVDERRKSLGFKTTLAEYLGNYTPRTASAYAALMDSLKLRYQNQVALGKQAMQEKDYMTAAKAYGQAMRCNGFIETEDIYASARAYGLLNSPRSAFNVVRRLRVLAGRGFSDIERLENDPAFTPYKEQAAWKEIVEIMRVYNVDE